MSILGILSKEFNKSTEHTFNIINMLDSGDTVPFISRYRKELTGGIESDELFKLEDRLNYLRNMEKRKQAIKNQMTTRNQLTKELEAQIDSIELLSRLEDFYEPFIPREDSPATKAKEKGLGVVAEAIKNNSDVLKVVEDMVKEKELPKQEIIEGAKDILYEDIMYNIEVKDIAKKLSKEVCSIHTRKKKSTHTSSSKDSEYDKFDEKVEDIKTIPSHRVLAMFRGNKEKAITLNINVREDLIKEKIKEKVSKNTKGLAKEILSELSEEVYLNSIKSSIESEIKKDLFTEAEERAIEVFSTNLKNLLLQKPLKDKVILGFDPGYVSGCKLAVIDKIGKLLDTSIIKVTPPHNKIEEGKKVVKELVDKYNIDVVAIGNGTGSKESEIFIANFIKENSLDMEYAIVSEAGASVYSASNEAIKEFPDLDIYFRSAISIARRLQDPLSELVKIDPKSLGVGQYQHDLNAKKLKLALDRVITMCVNTVGVDVNTSSVHLLKYVAGLNAKTAQNIIDYREENGRINSREEIKKIKGIGAKTYTQCIGFLRIYNGAEPLDKYFIHPENYVIARKIIEIDKITV